MIDRLLSIGSTFDWITPLSAWVQDVAHGGDYTFLIPWDATSLSGAEIRRLLRRHGIEAWGLMIVDDTLMVSVPKGQAALACALLDEAGVPYAAPPLPKRKSVERDGWDAMFGVFDRMGL